MKPTLWMAGMAWLALSLNANAAPAPIEATILLQTTHSWDGTPLPAYPTTQPELTVRKIVLQPGAQLPWHTHPMPATGYVVSGELHVETPDGKTTVLKPGQLLSEMSKVHRGRGGPEGSEVIAFYAGTPGLPLSVDAAEH